MIQSLKMALRSILSNRMRAVLTMLGIIIGVFALVVLVSLVNGATGTITDAVSDLGNSYMTVTVRNDKGMPVRLSDISGWTASEPALRWTAPCATDASTMRCGAKSGSATVYGTTPAYYEIDGLALARGRFLKNTDVENASRVCVIDTTTAESLIGYADCVGQTVTIGGTPYTVVGVLEGEEDTLTALFTAGDLVAYVPYTSLIRLSTRVTDDISSFYAIPPAGMVMDDAESAMRELLLERFDEDEDAFDISSQNLIEEAMDDITSVLSILLGGIAAISLFVGGVGIMNIMLVTVTERTREIGIRKAIGASRGTILRQFLIEAVILCMMGCLLGIFLSWAVLRIINVVVAGTELHFAMQRGVVIFSVVFCFIIGIVFGLYPANKAAKMKPIDALHYGG